MNETSRTQPTPQKLASHIADVIPYTYNYSQTATAVNVIDIIETNGECREVKTVDLKTLSSIVS